MEIWKDIDGFDGYYQISNNGRVKSKNGILKQYKNSRGYYRVALKDKKFHLVHRLVALHFVDNPDGYPIVNHIDENKTNNCASNLEWCTNVYNIYYGNARKKFLKTVKKHPVVQIFPNGDTKIWESTRAVERELGFGHSNIARCCKGLSTQSHGFKWKYLEGDL